MSQGGNSKSINSGEKSRSREYGRAGNGLAIVKELIEAHQGKVGAEILDGEIRVWSSLLQ